MAIVRTDQQLHVVSVDPMPHNVRVQPLRNAGFNFVLMPNDRVGQLVSFKTRENFPCEVRCDLHPWMRAWVLIVDQPYATVTSADGTFRLNDLPRGEHELQVWHERVGYLHASPHSTSISVKIEDGQTTDIPALTVPFQTLVEHKQP